MISRLPSIADPLTISPAFTAELAKLPPIPAALEYLDGYADVFRIVRHLADSDVWPVEYQGERELIDFAAYHPAIRILMKHVCVWAFNYHAPRTVHAAFRDLRALLQEIGPSFLMIPFEQSPIRLREYWHEELLPCIADHGWSAQGLKKYYIFLCEFSLGCLSPGYKDFVYAFRGPHVDLYASVRSGDCFLSDGEQATIIDYLDDLSSAARKKSVDSMSLREACLLVVAYQHGMRPIQIAKLTLEDIVERAGGDKIDEDPIIHVRFSREKQRSERMKVPLLRKVKREWAILFNRFAASRRATPALFLEVGAVRDSFFGLRPASVGDLIRVVALRITGVPRTSMDLRHTAAQRLVDGGASHEDLAEFLGHSGLRTGLVYFAESATQAERLNKALAISTIFGKVAAVHRTKTIDKATLACLPNEKQVGGVPHGIPIAGIGACQLGQGLCTKNPVLSCYGCRKVIPVRDIALHEEVRDTLRPVVQQFYTASRGETASPAYTQLRRTIGAVEQTIINIGHDPDAQE